MQVHCIIYLVIKILILVCRCVGNVNLVSELPIHRYPEMFCFPLRNKVPKVK